MKISIQEVKNISSLARLEVKDDKFDLFLQQFDNILSYMDKLNELETSNTEALYSPVEHTTVLREDEPVSEFDREEILFNAPDEDGQYFVVPKIL
ncbi:MAG TPA: Asp-tRNA(Asn)/Glu-tRNA(Gln) amidotransferase subunit GatC [Desulfohalobiaceae bacterium]|nr:Asp-tRNA(Asn)/Glu-tRNA(Gln) amidotransferase subunit GatC [Desulfohalobiaceae bacterium]